MGKHRHEQDKLHHVCDRVRIAPPTLQTASRLLRLYREAYFDDRELVARVCDPTSGVHGLVENISEKELFAFLQEPDTLVLEIEPNDDGIAGFTILTFATAQQSSRERYRHYLLAQAFRADALTFLDRADEAHFAHIMGRGFMASLAEFVSVGGRAAWGALILKALKEMRARLRNDLQFGVVSRCLDAVRIKDRINSQGNVPIKAVTESLGLRKIAVCDQVRRLHGLNAKDLQCLGIADPTEASAGVEAILTYALYLGNGREVWEALLARA